MKNKGIERAVYVLGGQSALAEACSVTQGAVNKWLNGGGVKAEHMAKIIKATEGVVNLQDLCPELWHVCCVFDPYWERSSN